MRLTLLVLTVNLHVLLVDCSAVQISAGGAHTCAVLADTNVKCWGYGRNGQLGYGSRQEVGDRANDMGQNLPAVDLGTGRTAVWIATGEEHSCAILDDGTVKCWGRGSSGRLGYGDTTTRGDDGGEMGDALPTVELGTGRTAVQLASGLDYNCVILDDAALKCWGINGLGQLGYGDIESRGNDPNEMGDNLPTVDLGTGRTAVKIALGYDHTCAILDDGTVKCWGLNSQGQLGLGDTVTRGNAPNQMGDNLPTVDLGTGRSAVNIAAGDQHTCVVLEIGAVKCWGDGGDGRLGYGNPASRGSGPNQMGDNLPTVDLGTGRSAVNIAAGDQHTCAVLDNATIKCWGANGNGELGYGDTGDRGATSNEMGDDLPIVDLGTGRTVQQIALGAQHSCVILDDATAKCWGNGGDGRLGSGDRSSLGNSPNEMGDDLQPIDLGATFAPTSSPSTSAPTPETIDLCGTTVASLSTRLM